MTAREQAVIDGIVAVDKPTSPEGARAIAALFGSDRDLYIDFLDPDSIESFGDRIARTQRDGGGELWSSKLLAARAMHPEAFRHLFTPDLRAA